ncbi:HEAT repeat domain-containing protein [Myxococcaceae bacterium JPH2]|nr:HEAT repeat domain-containing protein [Myxococcaceae bacterium JPH2]
MSHSEERDARSTEELIQAALAGDEDDEGAWEAIWTLRRRGTRTELDAALQLLGSPSARARGCGVDILAQLGAAQPTFSAERGDALLDLLRREQEPAVLCSIGVALGHLREPRALSVLLDLANHPSAEARYGATHGLSVLESPEALAVLIRLSADQDRDVRDWATFSLGSLREDLDTPELRDALAARLHEEDSETFGEALVGLATRKDPRAVEPARAALGGGRVTVYVLEAASALGEPSFYPLLIALRDSRAPADEHFRSVLDEVIAQFERGTQT